MSFLPNTIAQVGKLRTMGAVEAESKGLRGPEPDRTIMKARATLGDGAALAGVSEIGHVAALRLHFSANGNGRRIDIIRVRPMNFLATAPLYL